MLRGQRFWPESTRSIRTAPRRSMENEPGSGTSGAASETTVSPSSRRNGSSSSRSAHNGRAQRSYRRGRAPRRAENAAASPRLRRARPALPWRARAGGEHSDRSPSRAGRMAGLTGLEPATSCVTGRRSNQLNYNPAPLESRRMCSRNAMERGTIAADPGGVNGSAPARGGRGNALFGASPMVHPGRGSRCSERPTLGLESNGHPILRSPRAASAHATERCPTPSPRRGPRRPAEPRFV